MTIEESPSTTKAISRGKGKLTKRQFAALVKNTATYASSMLSMLHFGDALAQATGQPPDDEEDLAMYVARLRHLQSAAPVIGLYDYSRGLMANLLRLQDAPIEHGRKGGKAAAPGRKMASNTAVTPKQQRRRGRFESLRAVGMNDARALDMIAAEDKCTVAAVRQSLAATGLAISTKSNQGRHRAP